jgi:hypothetical protein
MWKVVDVEDDEDLREMRGHLDWGEMEYLEAV